jgi:hypothetical protein
MSEGATLANKARARATIHDELDHASEAFRELVVGASRPELCRRSNGTRWTNQQSGRTATSARDWRCPDTQRQARDALVMRRSSVRFRQAAPHKRAVHRAGASDSRLNFCATVRRCPVMPTRRAAAVHGLPSIRCPSRPIVIAALACPGTPQHHPHCSPRARAVRASRARIRHPVADLQTSEFVPPHARKSQHYNDVAVWARARCALCPHLSEPTMPGISEATGAGVQVGPEEV